jgi:microcin C transport system substrate-binding protein
MRLGDFRMPLISSMICLALLCAAVAVPQAHAAHAFAQFGDPRYAPDFTHFAYANPHAPRGGTLNLSVIAINSSFDKLNPFSMRGIPAPGLSELMFETLAIYSLDEPNTQYGLLAENIEVAEDFTSVTFRIREGARFNNGDALTAHDVKSSFDTLTGGDSPRFQAYFSEIRAVTVLDPLTVRFDFTRAGRDLVFVAGSLPVFSPRWGLTADGKRTPFEELRMEQPITSGPYVIEKAVRGKSVTYRRDPAYWGDQLAVRRGSFNFERIVYKLYKDADTQVAAIRAGEIDFFAENRMRYWCCQFIGHRFDRGELRKEKIRHQNLSAMNGYVFNLRREKFQDVRVRRALHLAYDWEWLNRKIFDNEFKRQDSLFANSSLAARGLPGDDELALLEPLRDQLDPAVFGPMVIPPRTSPPYSLRQNLTQALELLAQAGWHNRDGVLRNARGEPFVIEAAGPNGSNVLLDAYFLNLRKLGIEVRLTPPDPAALRARMRDFDFDFTSIALREARDPGAELWRNFNSASADLRGSENIVGVKSTAIDSLMRSLLDANTQQEQQAAARALDRVMAHGYYVLPWRYLTEHYLIYNQRLRRPATAPSHFGPYEWLLASWWEEPVSGSVAGR